MKKIPIMLALVLGCLSPSLRAADEILTVAVLDFQSAGQNLQGKGAEVGILLSARLSGAGDLMVVERQEIEKLLGEQELGRGQFVKPETAAATGELLGAKVLVTGRIFSSEGNSYVVAKVMSVETGRVFGEMVSYKEGGSLAASVDAMGDKLQALMEKRKDVLVAKVETEEERMARWAKLVPAGTKLKVQISIPEVHIGIPTVDPAVETTLSHALMKLGFEVASKPDDADVLLAGEAFSERGMQKGNLVSCRARVEIKLKDRKSGQVLLVDRSTASAVDLGEHIAGKEALENAAAKLMPKILPFLVKK